MHHISQPNTKVRFTIRLQDAHELEEGPASQKGKSGTTATETNQPARKGKLDLPQKAPPRSKVRNLNIQIQGSQDLPNK